MSFSIRVADTCSARPKPGRDSLIAESDAEREADKNQLQSGNPPTAWLMLPSSLKVRISNSAIRIW